MLGDTSFGEGPLCIPPDLLTRVVVGDLAKVRCNLWGEIRVPGLACIAEQGVHRMPPHPGHGIVECVENVGDGPGVGVLIEEFEAASANDGARVR